MGFSKGCFHCPERLVCYINSRKSFFTIDFHDLLHEDTGITKGYRGLQGVTGGYKGFQGVTKDYREVFF